MEGAGQQKPSTRPLLRLNCIAKSVRRRYQSPGMRALAREDFTPDERAVPPAPVVARAVAPLADGRDGEPGAGFAIDRGLNWKAVVAILLLHALVIGGILAQRQHMARKRVAEAMLVVNLAPPAPPPPQKAAPEIAEIPPVVVPPPVISIENPPPSITAVVMENPPPPRAAAVANPAPAPPAPAAVAPVNTPAPRIAESADLGAGLIDARPPRYPHESRRRHEQGVVTLLVLVGEDGKVAEITVRKSSGFRRLDEAALAAVREWRWRPTVIDGHPVMVRGFVPIPFELRAG